MRAITEQEYLELKARKPWPKSMSYRHWLDSIGAYYKPVHGRIVRGGKVHILAAQVVDLPSGDQVVIDAYYTCGSGRRHFHYYIRVGADGPQCGKCFPIVREENG